MVNVLDGVKFVVDSSKQVRINEKKIEEFCAAFTPDNIKHWFSVAPFDFSGFSDGEKLHFLLVFGAMSFCYWGEPKWTVQYQNKKFDGSWGMVTALRRAIDSGTPVLDMQFLANITKGEFSDILQGNVEIPLFEERLKIIREIGRVLVEKYGGDFGNLVKSANNDALRVRDLIVEAFPNFNDFSIYKGRKIYFYKRAQLLTGDIYQVFDGKGYGNLKNTSELTACADYKLPQVLRKLGVFEYSPNLAAKIDGKIEILKDSKEELEIRANTIWAVELMKQKLRSRISHIDAVHVSDHLWLASQTKSPDEKPYHRTKTISY